MEKRIIYPPLRFGITITGYRCCFNHVPRIAKTVGALVCNVGFHPPSPTLLIMILL